MHLYKSTYSYFYITKLFKILVTISMELVSLKILCKTPFLAWIHKTPKTIWKKKKKKKKPEGQEHFSRDNIYSLSDSHRDQWPKPMMREGETGLSGFRASLSESSDSKDLMVCFHSWGDKRGGHFMNRFSPKSDIKFCPWKTSNSLNQNKTVPTLMKYTNSGRQQWPF